MHRSEWIAARDTAVLLLLYGCGLRISEALGLQLKDAPTAERDVLRIVGKGGKERLVPVLPVAREGCGAVPLAAAVPARAARTRCFAVPGAVR